jgi:hypothetical protein
MKIPIAVALFASLIAASPAAPARPMQPVKVEVVKSEKGFRLLRGGEPYVIRGAGMVHDDLARFAAHGGNSIRNWTTDDSVQDVMELLDRAHEQGVTVALCLPMVAERHGFDYDDPAAVSRQLESFREDVVRYRDHPALLMWIIGNELNHSYRNPRVWDAVDDVAEMIHEVDPNHPATTAVSGFDAQVVAEIQARAPNLDFVSFQLYGMLFALPKLMREAGFTEPFMVTEWGSLGWWEMGKTSWGAPLELTSSEKAGVFRRAHDEVLASFDGQLIGSYVFKWGQKQERTPTWFGLFLESGEATESLDVMHYLWTGNWPANRSPRVRSLRIGFRSGADSVTLAAGKTYRAKFDVLDPEGDPLRFRWEIKPESDATQVGGDFEAPIASIEGWLSDPQAANTSITVPAPGQYRLFAYAFDDHGNAAHANIPLRVEPR